MKKIKICKNCGEEYFGTGKYYCSIKCYGDSRKGKSLPMETRRKMSIVHKGMHNSPATEFKPQKHCYRGGKSARSWRRRAIWTLEKKYGIDWKDMHLPDNPVIHHIDGNPMNNDFKNLCVTTRSDHALIHYDDRAKRFTNMVK